MKKQMILLGMLMAFCMAEAKVTLPALFTDNMVSVSYTHLTLPTNREV